VDGNSCSTIKKGTFGSGVQSCPPTEEWARRIGRLSGRRSKPASYPCVHLQRPLGVAASPSLTVRLTVSDRAWRNVCQSSRNTVLPLVVSGGMCCLPPHPVGVVQPTGIGDGIGRVVKRCEGVGGDTVLRVVWWYPESRSGTRGCPQGFFSCAGERHTPSRDGAIIRSQE